MKAMKKISEEIESEEAELFCSCCCQVIEECYEVCYDCETSRPFLLCNNCPESIAHDHSHNLAMRTVSKGSGILDLVGKPSQDSRGRGRGVIDLEEGIDLGKDPNCEDHTEINLEGSLDYEIDLTSSLPAQHYHQTPTTSMTSMTFIPTLDESCEMPEEGSAQRDPTGKIDRSWSEGVSFESGSGFLPEFPAGANPESPEPSSPMSVRRK